MWLWIWTTKIYLARFRNKSFIWSECTVATKLGQTQILMHNLISITFMCIWRPNSLCNVPFHIKDVYSESKWKLNSLLSRLSPLQEMLQISFPVRIMNVMYWRLSPKLWKETMKLNVNVWETKNFGIIIHKRNYSAAIGLTRKKLSGLVW